ncbi:MAG: hypothetical protein COT71_01410 [Candidatus Andersenbacteria bacterium CG10_big_fil_rev_8_21_14_0_10_54_11]|uniref:Chalcone isomerase domain-containing protein n=1 Tax=Candidatus Andersenbacteria bacterium CG10_big_fil_rev_8_21_14_0_10_54_11 TaxID=1974485 RepID=A0A2M6WZX6_9BACT|nr:MAG: hypothetical protein COT71_01410 [Candidatus Andersenbacteria bacterium CG10_big_fil_rev_8_21_14_0_10_54_11]
MRITWVSAAVGSIAVTALAAALLTRESAPAASRLAAAVQQSAGQLPSPSVSNTPLPSIPPTSSRQPDSWRFLSSKSLHLAFAYPPEWQQHISVRDSRITLTAGEDDIKALLTLYLLPAGTDIGQWVDQRLAETDAAITSRVQIRINNDVLIKATRQTADGDTLYNAFHSLPGNRIVAIEWYADDAVLNEMLQTLRPL